MKKPPRNLCGRTVGFGDRSVFYCEVRLSPEEDPYATPEEAASWGNLEIWAAGRNLCAHYEGTELLTGISWHLLPFFEWLAHNWNYLFHEQRPPVRLAGSTAWESLNITYQPDEFERMPDGKREAAASEAYRWIQRHSLWACRDGGLFPDLVMRRDLDTIEFSWSCEVPAGAPADFRFVNGKDSAHLPPEAVTESFYRVLMGCSAALREYMPDSARIQALDKAVRRLTQPVQRDRRLTILAGLGETVADWQKGWTRLKKRLHGDLAPVASFFTGSDETPLVVAGNCEGALMYGSAAPNMTVNDVLGIAERLVHHSRRRTRTDRLADHSRHVPLQTDEPYREGYRLAESWAEESRIWDGAGAVEIKDHLDQFGVTVEEIALSDPETRGVAIARREMAPLILVNMTNELNHFPTGHRFTLAHELCHLLYDRSRGQAVALISGPWAPKGVEKRANAFAAMLLMPPQAVENAFTATDGDINDPDVEKLAEAARLLQVSPDALVHHLHNLGYITHGQLQLINRRREELSEEYLESKKENAL